ncbi:alpha/beta hydrolase [Alisedimentitalea sp. MJ-SS2]|uniref:alpha/beta fold hydrolase n=1 Tax=Aliisedimentitalea sp. MJ-SS2 TaxID=3049795 RepID=UPI002906CD4B|nr:alpha/beta hydrolase [Alisedimentitalea sp. MJ-SS2]MDU8927388.1 alpha/beta hydrolase [Alisedimentitalea sp. MJ-SS2]
MIDWQAGRGVLSAEGKRLEWASWGVPRDRPVIVLLHEGLGCVALWREFPRALAEVTGCAVFAYSRAGYGQSDSCDLPRPLDYMTHEAVEVLPEVLDVLGAEPVVLMGHSDGATIAAEYAGRVGDARVEGVVLMAPHFFAEDEGLTEIARAREAFETTDLREKLGRYHSDVEAAFDGWNGAWLDPGFREWNVEEALDGVRVPVLVIQGHGDQYGTLAQVAAVTERLVEARALVLDECRHAPQFDQPEVVLDAVAEFVEGFAGK